jgi:murein DD-endopeptidase MepM/ murein hydrolase activator NlpD
MGIDIQAPEGTPLSTITSGVVYATSYSNDFGNLVIVKGKDENGKTVYVLYAHLSKVDVKGGQKLTAGQQIGLTGTTGNAKGLEGTDQHVHIEVATTPEFRPMKYGVGTRVDPETIIPTKFDADGNPIVSAPPPATNNNNSSGSRPVHNEMSMKPLFTWPKSAPWRVQFVH